MTKISNMPISSFNQHPASTTLQLKQLANKIQTPQYRYMPTPPS